MHAVRIFVELVTRFETILVFSKRFGKGLIAFAERENRRQEQMNDYHMEEGAGRQEMSNELDESTRKLSNELN